MWRAGHKFGDYNRPDHQPGCYTRVIINPGERVQQMARQQIKTNPDNDTSYVDGSREHLLIINGQECTDREYARVMNAQPYPWTEEEIRRDQERFNRPPFSLLR
jgi:hypothetical protein